jgi:alkanesulfonate monooxygenase SsuD/methylene tetrahydromethanopterin reductase-like flavin-dependent oxidoreductase (luciferase family)
MGFHALWFTETLFSRTPTGPGWTSVGSGGDRASAMGTDAAETSRIRLGIASSVKPDSLVSLATETANQDILSHGRLSLGLSQHSWLDEGVSEGGRPRVGVRLQETITLLNRLWSEDEVPFKGSHHHLERPLLTSGRSKNGVSRSLSPRLPVLLFGRQRLWRMDRCILQGEFLKV